MRSGLDICPHIACGANFAVVDTKSLKQVAKLCKVRSKLYGWGAALILIHLVAERAKGLSIACTYANERRGKRWHKDRAKEKDMLRHQRLLVPVALSLSALTSGFRLAK
jgi:hypothetical protein